PGSPVGWSPDTPRGAADPARRATPPATTSTATSPAPAPAPATHEPGLLEPGTASANHRTRRAALAAPVSGAEPAVRPAASAASTAPAVWNRSSGFFDRHLTMTSDSQCGMLAFTSLATGTGSARCLPTISALESP